MSGVAGGRIACRCYAVHLSLMPEVTFIKTKDAVTAYTIPLPALTRAAPFPRREGPLALMILHSDMPVHEFP